MIILNNYTSYNYTSVTLTKTVSADILLNNMRGSQARMHDCCASKKSKQGAFTMLGSKRKKGRGFKESQYVLSILFLSFVLNECVRERGGGYGYSGCLFVLMVSMVVAANAVNHQILS